MAPVLAVGEFQFAAVIVTVPVLEPEQNLVICLFDDVYLSDLNDRVDEECRLLAVA